MELSENGINCPNCENQGWYPIETGGCDMDGENDTRQIEQIQCEFCYTTPNSVFNVELNKNKEQI
ncbi:MAG TPA: hypothetical protein VIH30_08975 [Aquirhabdus sp.]